MDLTIIQTNKFQVFIFQWLNSFDSQETKRCYKFSVEDYFKKSLKDITHDDILNVNIVDVENYLELLIKNGKKSNTIRTRISACVSLYDYLLSFQSNNTNIKLLNFNPFKNSIIKNEKHRKIIKGDEKLIEILTDEELLEIFNHWKINT